MHFQIAELCEARSEDEIRRALANLPRDLSKTYLRIVSRIFGSKTAFSTERVELIICWLMCARRPLTIEELSEALAIREDDICLVRDRIVQDGKQLLQDCGNLVVIDPEDGTVKFAHHTVREFFIRRHWELSIIVNSTDEDDDQNHSILPDANSKIARLCLQYLHFSDFESQITLRSESQTAVPFNEGLIEAIVPQQLSPIARTVADCFFRPSHRTRDITLKFPQKREHNPLEQKYHMLDYVTGNWPYHLPEKLYYDGIPEMASAIAFEKQFTFRCRPWDIPEYSDLSPTNFPSLKRNPPPPALAAFRWSIDEGVASLLQMILEYHDMRIDEYIRFESQSTLPSRQVLRRAASSLCSLNTIKVARAIKKQGWVVPLEEINALLSSKKPDAFAKAVYSMDENGVSIGYGGVSSSIFSNTARSQPWYGQKWKYSTTDYSKIFPLQLNEAIEMDDIACVEILTSIGTVPERRQVEHAAIDGRNELLTVLCKAVTSRRSTHSTLERENNLLYLRELRENLYMQRHIVQGNIVTSFCRMLDFSEELDGREIAREETTEREANEAEGLQQRREERRKRQTEAQDERTERDERVKREKMEEDREIEDIKREQERDARRRYQILAENEQRGRLERERRERGQRDGTQEDKKRSQGDSYDLDKSDFPHHPEGLAMAASSKAIVDRRQTPESLFPMYSRKDDQNHTNSASRRWTSKNEDPDYNRFPRANTGRENSPRFFEIQKSTVVINKDVLILVSVCSCGLLFFILNALVLALAVSLGLFPSLRGL